MASAGAAPIAVARSGINWTTGAHHVRLDVFDASGNVTSIPWTVQYYATSWKYGDESGERHSVDMPGEVAAVRTALEGTGGYLHGPVWEGLLPADQPRIYPTSWVSGSSLESDDHSINTDAERAAVMSADAAMSTTERQGLWGGVAPQDISGFNDYFVRTASDEDSLEMPATVGSVDPDTAAELGLTPT